MMEVSAGGTNKVVELQLLGGGAQARSDNENSSGVESSEATARTSHSFLPGPPCVKNIVLCELCERFCYYGLRAVLVLFFVDSLQWGEGRAVALFSYTSSAAYFAPLVGGHVSDAYFGRFRTIRDFSIIYLLGTLLLSCGAFAKSAGVAIAGLLLISLGTGGIKPCVSAFGADQFYKPDGANDDALTRYFASFYFAINLGSVLSFIFIPLVRRYAGFGAAFATPSALLSLSLVVFLCARKKYRKLPPGGSALTRLGRVMLHAARSFRLGDAVTGCDCWLERARNKPGVENEDVGDAVALWNLAPFFSVMPLFWSCFDQQGSAWTLQAKAMNLGSYIEPENMQILNPILVMLLLPLLDRFVYPALRSRNLSVAPLRRMFVGMVLAVVSFLMSAILQIKVEAEEGKISVFAQIPQYFCLTLAEVLVSVTGLEFSYAQAPPRMKALVSALWLTTTAVGDLLTGVLFSALSAPLSTLLLVFAVLMAANAVAFGCVARSYARKQSGGGGGGEPTVHNGHFRLVEDDEIDTTCNAAEPGECSNTGLVAL